VTLTTRESRGVGKVCIDTETIPDDECAPGRNSFSTAAEISNYEHGIDQNAEDLKTK
jgi:hypothetical protein